MTRLGLYCIAATVSLLSATSSIAGWDDVVAAAKREGAVTLYTTALGAPFNRTIADAQKAVVAQ